MGTGAGQLDNLVQIESHTPTKDSLGADVVTWSLFAQAWASITEQRGDEGPRAGQRVARREVLVRIRYVPGVLPQMRVVAGSRILLINMISFVGRNRYIDLVCEDFNG